MSNSPAPSDASHDSGDHEDGSSKLTATKDKECQYCHQKFTSSSLGRHLDQFLTKKKPDGIHDVEEIRKLRAGITRRTARGSKKSGNQAEAEESNTHSKDASPVPPHSFNTPTYVDHNLNKGLPGTNDVRFNRMNWQATGVITDAPAVVAANAPIQSQDHNSSNSNVTPTGTKRSFSTYAADASSSTSSETARALELALREVLDAVKAATKRGTPSPRPFSFDFEAQTFPVLCLLLLPAPATLFQASPFATPGTIPLAPPGLDQQHALRQKIPLLVDNWKWDALSHAQRNPVPGGANMLEEAEYLTNSARKWISDALVHLDAAYQSYMNQSAEQKHQQWNIELLRAYKSEQEKVKESREQFDKVTQQANQLQQQIDYLSRCQWPREMALWPPEKSVFEQPVQQELRAAYFQADTGTASSKLTHGSKSPTDSSRYDRWDYDKLVNKWKKHVREDRARRTGIQTSTNLSFNASSTALASVSDDILNGRTNTPPSSLRKAMSECATGTGQNSPITNGTSIMNANTSTIHATNNGRSISEASSIHLNSAKLDFLDSYRTNTLAVDEPRADVQQNSAQQSTSRTTSNLQTNDVEMMDEEQQMPSLELLPFEARGLPKLQQSWTSSKWHRPV